MKNKVNIRQISNESGLSIASISRVINGKAGVTEETRKYVSDILKKHAYVLNSHLSREKRIALLCGHDKFGDYISDIINGIHAYSNEHVLNTSIIFKNDKLKMTTLERIREQQCVGVIIILPLEFKDDLDVLANSELPVILIDQATYEDGIGFIDHDAYSGSREATKYLLEMGHRNIGYIESGVKTFNHLQRIKAYENTLKESGIKILPEWHIKTEQNLSIQNAGYLKMLKLLKFAPELTAVMTSNDNIAMGVMKAIFDSGKSVPEDISVIGFDNYPQTEYFHPALTTVNHPAKESGYMAAKEIDIYLKKSKDRVLPREILPTKLIIRESVSNPRKIG